MPDFADRYADGASASAVVMRGDSSAVAYGTTLAAAGAAVEYAKAKLVELSSALKSENTALRKAALSNGAELDALRSDNNALRKAAQSNGAGIRKLEKERGNMSAELEAVKSENTALHEALKKADDAFEEATDGRRQKKRPKFKKGAGGAAMGAVGAAAAKKAADQDDLEWLSRNWATHMVRPVGPKDRPQDLLGLWVSEIEDRIFEEFGISFSSTTSGFITNQMMLHFNVEAEKITSDIVYNDGGRRVTETHYGYKNFTFTDKYSGS